jgi:hypothetical protein
VPNRGIPVGMQQARSGAGIAAYRPLSLALVQRRARPVSNGTV